MSDVVTKKITQEIVFQLLKEVNFSTSKSGGPGGQHVNKTNSKVTLKWHLDNSIVFSESEKQKINHKCNLSNGWLILNCDSERSQIQNKEIIIKKFKNVLQKAFKEKRKRKPTKPSRSSVKNRLDSKKKHGQKKSLRKNPEL